MMYKKISFLIFLATFLLIASVTAEQNASTTVEANILTSGGSLDQISIEVPDHIFLGNVTQGDATDKTKVYVNNTGTVAVTITPRLVDGTNNIFENLFFQLRQTGNSSRVYQIGDYHLNISAPSTTNGKKSEYFYVWLDLSDFDEEIEEDMLGETAEVVFIALPQ